jgi:hypothetical protein
MRDYHNQAAEKLGKIQNTPSAKSQLSAKRGVDRDKKDAFGTFGTDLGASIILKKQRKQRARTGWITTGSKKCKTSYTGQTRRIELPLDNDTVEVWILVTRADKQGVFRLWYAGVEAMPEETRPLLKKDSPPVVINKILRGEVAKKISQSDLFL